MLGVLIKGKKMEFLGVIFVIAIIIGCLYMWGAIVLATAAAILVPVWAWILASGALVLTFGTVPFWLLVAALTLFVAWCVYEGDLDNEVMPWSGVAVSTVVFFGVLIFFINKNSFSLEGYSGWAILGIVFVLFVAFLACGALYSRHRYINRNRRTMREIEKWRVEELKFLKEIHKLNDENAVADGIRQGKPASSPVDRYSPSNRENQERFQVELNTYNAAQNYKNTVEKMLGQARPDKNMHRIMTWIGLWPWCMLSQVLRDPVKMVYNMMISVYEAAYNSTFGTFESEFQKVFSRNEEQ